MGKWHDPNPPLADKNQLQTVLQAALPQYTYTLRGPSLIVGNGLVTGITVLPRKGRVKTMWGMPSMVIQILMTLTFFAGILPGLVLWVIVWSVVSGHVKQIESEIAGVLTAGGELGATNPFG